MKKYLFILPFLIVIGMASSCHKNDNSSTPTDDIRGDSLTAIEDDAIVASSVPNPPLSDIKDFLDDPVARRSEREQGGAITTPAATLVGKLLKSANLLADKKTSDFHAKDGDDKPEQYGYAYSYGIRDLLARHYPKDGNKLHKSQAVFGTDCSGFIINLFQLNGITVQNSVINDGTLLPAIQKALSATTDYASIKLTEQPAGTNIRPGDFIVWPNHIGIAYTSTNVQVYNSNGTPNPKDDADQKKNLGLTRGIHPFSLSDMIKDPAKSGYWGPAYKVYRMEDQNLITNGDFSQGNKGFITNYTYCDAVNCLFPLANNGYAVANDASTRHTLFKGIDHTNGKGQFMIVNGAISTATVWEQTVSVSANSDYNFIGWYCTLNTNSIPTLAVFINGSQISSPFAAPSTLSVWKNFRLSWNSAGSTSAKIQIFDTNNASNGNDFGLDDLYFAKK